MFSFHTTHVIVLSNLCVLILGVGKPCKTLNSGVIYTKAIYLERGDSDVRTFCAKPSHFSFSRLSHVLEHTWNLVLAEEKKSSCGRGWGAGKTLRLRADGAGAAGEIVVSAKKHATPEVVQKIIG